MAKKMDQDLFDLMRAKGVRKKVANQVAGSFGSKNAKAPKAARQAVEDFRELVGELELRVMGAPDRRKRAARKAASTRRANAARRSEAARRGARTRRTKPRASA